MARVKRFVVATLLAVAGGVAGCSNLAQVGVGFTLDPVGVQFTIRTAKDVASFTIVQPTGTPATGPAAGSPLPVVVVDGSPLQVK